MLESLLQLVAEGGISSLEDLAHRLAVPPPLLEAMLEDLVRLGYLRAVGTASATSGCSPSITTGDGGCLSDEPRSTCSTCSIGGCGLAGPGRAWTLTAKGAKAAARLPK